MTKHQILNQIFKEIPIDNIIKKYIIGSDKDGSYEDLRQEIYLILYDLPFSKLYILYSRKQIANYIVGIIVNQRNSPYLEYNKYFKTGDTPLFEDKLEPDYQPIEKDLIEDTLEQKLEAINTVLYKKYPIKDIDKFSYIQKAEFFSIEIYKLYLKKKLNSRFSFTRLSQELNISRTLISESIQDAKRIIRKEYRNILKNKQNK